jgi:adenylate cyclase
MVSKIFLGIALVSSIAFLSISLFVGRQVESALQDSSEGSATQMAGLVRSSLEQAMLSGNGIKVKRLVEELKASVDTESEIHIYDANGIEVFTPKAPTPAPADIDAHVAQVLRDRTRVVSENQITRAIPMEERCSRDECHDSSDTLRGVLSMRVRPESCQEARSGVVSEIVKSAFIHMMTARRASALDDYFADISKTAPSISAVAVYDNEGDPSFGRDMEELGVSGEQVLEAMSQGEARSLATETGAIEVLPLPWEARCIECHEQEEELRGALLVALSPSAVESGCDAEELEALIDVSLRHIMTSELGRIIARFLDSVAETAAVDELILYDKEGRVYWNTTHETPPAHVAAVLSSQKPVIDLLGSGEQQRVRIIEPLENSPECARCHGSESPLRGFVEVSMSTKMAHHARLKTRSIVLLTTAFAAVGLLLVLVVLLNLLVIRPVREISGVATSIGDGNLTVEVKHADGSGDEVARLGDGINTMIGELRTKFHLEKFVSKGAVEAAAEAGARESMRAGERTEATVLFSDIRGFTAYSESVEAEEVVAMLNRLLKAQTDVVHEYSGDVDKFVGDELMAIFQGEGANQRATSCALAMIDAVHEVRESKLGIGVGISTGEVVMGAIGHEDRLDFTVIGDVVNVGARLCSAAKADEVLVTAAVRLGAGEDNACDFEKIEPLSVKGKKDALVVYRVVKAKKEPDKK